MRACDLLTGANRIIAVPGQRQHPAALPRMRSAGLAPHAARGGSLRLWAVNIQVLGILLCAAVSGSSLGAPPPAPGDAPVGAPPDFSTLSAADRLGIPFKPPARESDSAFLVARTPDTVLLPRFVVKDTRVKLTQGDVLTERATLAMAEDLYLSPLYRVAFGPLMQVAAYYFNPLSLIHGWHPNEAEARTLYKQDERLRKLGELDSLIGLELLDDPKGAAEFQRIRFDASVSSR